MISPLKDNVCCPLKILKYCPIKYCPKKLPDKILPDVRFESKDAFSLLLSEDRKEQGFYADFVLKPHPKSMRFVGLDIGMPAGSPSSKFGDWKVVGKLLCHDIEEHIIEFILVNRVLKCGPHLVSPWWKDNICYSCLLYTSPSPRDATLSRMPSSA